MSKKQNGKPAAKPAKAPSPAARKADAAKKGKAEPRSISAAAKPASLKLPGKNAKTEPKLAKPAAAAVKNKAKTPVKPVSGPMTAHPQPVRTMAVSKPEQTKKTEGGSKKMAAPRPKVSEIVLPAGYRPSEDEPFMNEMHRAYFRKRLLDWKDEILRQTRETLAILHEDSTQHADLADRATSETDRATELRTRDRQRKLIAKIDAAIARIEDGSYGYCEETGEPIGLKRLDARPIATLSVEAQERHERREKVYREE